MSIKNTLKEIGKRIATSNNRSLGTLFGCIMGGVVGLVYVLDGTATLAIIGRPDTLAKSVFAVLLAAGTGGNLSSYIGATVDIITGEKTIIDLYKNFTKEQTEHNSTSAELAPSTHQHFPYITSLDNKQAERLSQASQNERELYFLRNMVKENSERLNARVTEIVERKDQRTENGNDTVHESKKGVSPV